MFKVRPYGLPKKEGFFQSVQPLFSYRVGNGQHPVPQSEVRCAQGVLHLFRDGHQHEEPFGKLHGRAIWGHREKTARLFMLKVRESMESSGDHPMDGAVHVDEFVLGGVEKGKIGRSYDAKKKKAVTAVQLTPEGKVRRMYAMRIQDFSARSLQYIIHQQYKPGRKGDHR